MIESDAPLLGSIDALEGGLARVLIASGDRALEIPVSALPPGTGEGDWVALTPLTGGGWQVAARPEETARARARVRGKLDRLRARGRQR